MPEIIKDIEARIIRPTSTDNAIVRFNGTTGQVQNSTPLIDDSGIIVLPTNSGSIIKGYNAANSNSIFHITAGDQDVSILRADHAFSESGSWGYSLKYRGTGSGLNNFLTLYADNLAASSQVIGLSINQSGCLGVGADPKSTHRLYINGKTYCEDSITLQVGNYAYDGYGLVFGDNNARIGADIGSDLGLYANNNLYVRTGCNIANNDYPNGILITPTAIYPITGIVNLGTASHLFQSLYLSSNAYIGGNITIDASNNVDRFVIFNSGDSSGYSWRMGYLGSGSGEANYFVIQSNSTNATYTNALRIGLNSLDAQFRGNIIPAVTNSKTLGTNALKWSNVYSAVFTGNLTGTATNATNVTVTAGSGNLERPLVVNSSLSGQNLWHVEGVTANYQNKTLTAAGGFIGNLTGNATTATTTTYIVTEQGTVNSNRHVFFAYDGDAINKRRVVYDDSFKYNPSTNTLTVGSITGSAASASKDGKGNVIASTYLPLAGGTMTGDLRFLMGNSDKLIHWQYSSTPADDINWRLGCLGTGSSDANYFVIQSNGTGATTSTAFKNAIRIGANTLNVLIGSTTASTSKTTGALVVSGGVGIAGSIYANAVYGAVWNDYAEFRTQKETIEPGYCVASTDNGEVYKTSEKFQPCDGIVSDTFGFAIGETDNCKTPLAVAGRVLAYCEGNRYDYHAGDTVCAGPNGKVAKMTREEIREWPDRIIGVVSEIPDYETWGSGNVKVDGRIWVKVK